MMTYISMLRGINVSGQKVIKMEALRKIYEDLGMINVKTYIQSGNVIFRSNRHNHQELGNIISTEIQKQFKFEVHIIVLTIDELKEIIEKNPFVTDLTMDISNLYITFLATKPSNLKIEEISTKKFQGEKFSILNKAVYLCCSNGYGKSKLNNNYFENTLHVAATTRNWRTANELLKLSLELI